MRAPFAVLVLGGTGVFGSRICRRLARELGLEVFVGGRSLAAAERLAREIRRDTPDSVVRPCAVTLPGDLPRALGETGARLVIHTCGPFQGQDTRVAETCIERRVHYLDLADDRAFVASFASLDKAARRKGVMAVSGVSAVPALSFAVAEALRRDMAALESIAIGITPGIRSPRGLAVVAGILSYTGKAIPRWQDGAWRHVHGWQDLRRRRLSTARLGSLGSRWFAACDVPDNVLFPAAYPGVRSVAFHAGLELAVLHWGLWLLSWPGRGGLVRSLQPAARLLRDIAACLAGLGTDRGGMYVELAGADTQGRSVTRTWTLVAEAGDGPWVPCLPAVILARKLAHNDVAERGAMACLGLVSLAEFESEAADLRIDTEVAERPAPDRNPHRNPSPSPLGAK